MLKSAENGRLRRGRAQALWSVVSLLAAGIAVAAEPPMPPPFFAIENARVVIGTGEVLERGTVLIADGLIEAVGTDIAVPADAWVIDGDGWLVLPGLIDTMTTLGQEQADDDEDNGGRRGFGGGGPVIRGPEDRPSTTPWVDAADLIEGEDSRIDTWREGGYTAALTAPEKGFFAGQAAIITLGHAEPGERVVASGLAHRINFRGDGGFRTFPGSLMGGIAYVKQVLIDAEHYGRVEAMYAESPRGLARPRYDRTLAPLHRAIEEGQGFLAPATWGREIDRVLSLSRDYGIRPILFGGQGAYERVARLAASRTPVLVDVDWPEAEKDRDPEVAEAVRDLAHRELAPAVPAMLADAGVAFAFASNGLSGPTSIFEGVRAAIEAGLAESDALEALTLGPARIFGVADRLGSVEVGKIANLVVASGMPWAEDVEIAAVFVDGRRYAERTSEEDVEPPASDPSGTWALTLVTPRGNRDMTAELDMDDDGKVTGELTGERGTNPIEKGRMSADRLRFEVSREMGGRTMTMSISMAIDGDQADGSMSAGPMSMDVTGERTATADADSEDAGADAPAVPREEILEVLAMMRGPVSTDDTFAVTNAQVWTVSGPTLDSATVVVRAGRIAAVGTDVAVPDGVPVIDAEGGALIPGIIDAHSHIAAEGGVNEGSLAVSSMVTIRDVVRPEDIAIYRALAGGVTTINVLHGSANPIGGGNAVLKMRWGQDAEGMLFEDAPKGIKFALGENPKRSNARLPRGMQARYPGTRMGVMDVIRNAFAEAEAYRDGLRDYEAAIRRGETRLPPRRDLELEPLVEILEGERFVHAHSYRADEILQLMRLAEELGFRVRTLQHVLEGYKVADEIAAHGAGASTFSDWWGYKVEAFDAIPHNTALMTERGVLVSINSDSGEEMRHLNQEAAKAVRWGGMDPVAALATVTLNPAIQLGIDDRVGSIEVGKDADLVLYDGPPLSVRSVVQKTWVDGDLTFDREADRRRQATLENMRERLATSDDDEEDGADSEDGEDGGTVRWRHVAEIEPYTCREHH